MKSLSGKQTAILAARIALEKKAEDIVILDIHKVSNYCDYFVVCSAPSTTRIKAIAEGIQQGLRLKNVRLTHKEGEREALWVLLDFVDVVVHIFLADLRDFYKLEHLWREAPRLKF